MIKYKVYDNLAEEYMYDDIVKGIIGLTPEGRLFRIRSDGTIDLLSKVRY